MKSATTLKMTDWLLPLTIIGGVIGGVLLSNQMMPKTSDFRPIIEPIRWVKVQAISDNSIPVTSNTKEMQSAKESLPLSPAKNESGIKSVLKPTSKPAAQYVANLTTNADSNIKAKTLAKSVINQSITPKIEGKPLSEQTFNSSIDKPKNDNKGKLKKLVNLSNVQPIVKENVDSKQSFTRNIQTDIQPAKQNKMPQLSAKVNSLQQIDNPRTNANFAHDTGLKSSANVATNEKKVDEKFIPNHQLKTQDNVKINRSSIAQNSMPIPEPKDQSIIDNSNHWKTQFVARVNRNKIYPSNARKIGEEGSVLLTIQIMANGDINCCEIKQSSGSNLLDKAAIQAAQKAVNQISNKLQTNKIFGFDFYVDYILVQ